MDISQHFVDYMLKQYFGHTELHKILFKLTYFFLKCGH